MLKGLVVLILSVSAWASTGYPWQEKDLLSVEKLGCNVDQWEGRFRTNVWLKPLKTEQRDSFTLSFRDTRSQAMKDCSEWMDEAEKRTLKAKQQLQKELGRKK